LLAPILVCHCAQTGLDYLLRNGGKRYVCRLPANRRESRKRSIALTQPRHDPRIERGARLIFRTRQQVGAGAFHALLGVLARFLQESPLLQPTGYLKIIRCLGRTACDPGFIEILDYFGVASLTGPRFGCFHHPLRIAVAQFVELLVVADGLVQLVETLFQICPRLVEILLLRTDMNRLAIGIDGRRIILQSRLQPRQHDAPASVARRGFYRLPVEID